MVDPAVQSRYWHAMSDTPPDRLSIHPDSPYYGGDILQRGIGVRFRGSERRDVEEYCISEGWIRVQAGRTLDRRGRPLLIKLNGAVEAWFEDAASAGDASADQRAEN